MRAYIINLDSAADRWTSVTQAFACTPFVLCRVPAVNGHALQLPIEEYSESLYRRFHGRPTSLGHVGCYLSHVKAMKAFLESGEEHALIAEDDLLLRPDFEAALTTALVHSGQWNILRLTGLSDGRPAAIARLTDIYSLCVAFARLKGTGAYLIDRHAARILSTGMLPMRLPIDHALDREWFFGLRAASIHPFPASQVDSGFVSSIHRGKSQKLPLWKRCLGTYPYQAFNEVSRWLFRSTHYLGIRGAVLLHRLRPA